MSQQYQPIPSTPGITLPTPDALEPHSTTDNYFAPRTRSTTRKRTTSPTPISAPSSSDDLRARSRSPKATHKSPPSALSSIPSSPPLQNGHLSPTSATTSTTSYIRSLSRSPSPLGLIPIHRSWRTFIHRHEIPRKALHVSIGFFTLRLYSLPTVSPSHIHPILLSLLIPITATEYLRHRIPSLNRIYIRCLGALMRESEVNDRYNGVIWYLLGAWIVLRFLPTDVAVMSILLLSWCDTAASTIGRQYGRYTPQIRPGKSLAGSAAAAIVGMLTAGLFYGIIVPRYGLSTDANMFTGVLHFPHVIQNTLPWKAATPKLGGWIALGVVSLWSGIVASASEVVDLWGWDDNLTIPVLSGIGLWGFLKVFG